jgi:hypothetical protein
MIRDAAKGALRNQKAEPRPPVEYPLEAGDVTSNGDRPHTLER